MNHAATLSALFKQALATADVAKVVGTIPVLALSRCISEISDSAAKLCTAEWSHPGHARAAGVGAGARKLGGGDAILLPWAVMDERRGRAGPRAAPLPWGEL